MTIAKGEINASVRNIVEFVLRSGNIDSRYMGATRAFEGTRIHGKIQKKRKNEAQAEGWQYNKEVTLKLSFEYNSFLFNVDGRADGIIIKNGSVAIEEIKSTYRRLSDIQKNIDHWHWAQAKCYGYIYCRLNGCECVGIILTYCNIDTEETLELEENYSTGELEEFFYDIIDKYWEFALLDHERVRMRNETAKALAFPYEHYRKGQRELAVSVYSSIKQEKNLFAQAPTGTGKTISALYPAVKALGEGFGEKLFYLTAKTITRQAAEDALNIMCGKGLSVKCVTLTARDKICPLEIRRCNPIDCERAKGHFDRINAAIYDIISSEALIKRAAIESYAEKHCVCPYELSLDVSLFCDCVICDYNYVYDPSSKLRRYFSDEVKNINFTILVDESHNLHDRAREMFSASLSGSVVKKCRMAVTKKTPLYKVMGKMNSFFNGVKKELNGASSSSFGKRRSVSNQSPEELCRLLADFMPEADEWLQQNEGRPGYEEMSELYFNVFDFMRVNDFFDERYAAFYEASTVDTSVKLLCLDPSYLLSQTHKKVRASVFFSATLTPLNYFKDVLGGGESDYILRLPSPFDPSKLLLLVDNTISTKYKDRKNSYEAIADRLYAMAASGKGNYFAFFSSYDYLNNVYDIFSDKYAHIRTIVQKQDMTEEDREAFLLNFSEENEETLLGFVVLGGIFSEGIDLVGERLIGAAVVGVGLPMITEERNVLSEYYGRKNGKGYEYAYMYPGMNKVMQAAGRVIRTENDRGVVLLIDSRFLNWEYREMFPAEWDGFVKVSGKTFDGMLRGFWGL